MTGGMDDTKEFSEGQEAFYEGKTINQVPYPVDSRKYREWEAGWKQSEMEEGMFGDIKVYLGKSSRYEHGSKLLLLDEGGRVLGKQSAISIEYAEDGNTVHVTFKDVEIR